MGIFVSKDGNVKIGRIVGSSIGVIAAAILAVSGFTSVPVGSTGVVVRLGEVTETTLTEGLHFKIPFIEDIVDMNNKIQKVEVDADSTSKDLQPIISTIAVNYHLSPEKSAEMYRNVGLEYTDTLLQPVIQESCKNVMAKYSAEQLVTQRSQVGGEIATDIGTRLQNEGIIVDKFNITNFSFSDEFNKSIEQKQVAEQEKIKNDTINTQKIAAAQAEAEQKRAAAQGEADAAKIRAEGEAEAIRIKADAEAEVNAILTKSLTPEILKQQYYEKWNGDVPNVVGSDSSFILPSDLVK